MPVQVSRLAYYDEVMGDDGEAPHRRALEESMTNGDTELRVTMEELSVLSPHTHALLAFEAKTNGRRLDAGGLKLTLGNSGARHLKGPRGKGGKGGKGFDLGGALKTVGKVAAVGAAVTALGFVGKNLLDMFKAFPSIPGPGSGDAGPALEAIYKTLDDLHRTDESLAATQRIQQTEIDTANDRMSHDENTINTINANLKATQDTQNLWNAQSSARAAKDEADMASMAKNMSKLATDVSNSINSLTGTIQSSIRATGIALGNLSTAIAAARSQEISDVSDVYVQVSRGAVLSVWFDSTIHSKKNER